MPIDLRDKITIQLTFPVRQKANGVYEVRYRAHGYNIAVSSKDERKLKPKFIAALKSCCPKQEEPQAREPAAEREQGIAFNAIAARWLELRKPLIKATTYEHYESVFRANIFPAYAGRRVDELKQSDCQELINRYIDCEKYRTADKIYQSLKAIFEFALGEELIERSPMRFVKPPQYEEQNGVALTLEEEREFLRLLAASNATK